MISIDRLIEIMNELANDYPHIAERIGDSILDREYCPFCGSKLRATNEDDLICDNCKNMW